MAKLKTRVDCRYRGVLKNQYGFFLSEARRAQYRGFMSKVIVDSNKFYRPDLSIIEGLVRMEGFGPKDGDRKPVGAVIASADPVTADAVGASLIGIRPSSIGYLKFAEKKRVGTLRDSQIIGGFTQRTQNVLPRTLSVSFPYSI